MKKLNLTNTFFKSQWEYDDTNETNQYKFQQFGYQVQLHTSSFAEKFNRNCV